MTMAKKKATKVNPAITSLVYNKNSAKGLLEISKLKNDTMGIKEYSKEVQQYKEAIDILKKHFKLKG